jgi:hypothetical protein
MLKTFASRVSKPFQRTRNGYTVSRSVELDGLIDIAIRPQGQTWWDVVWRGERNLANPIFLVIEDHIRRNLDPGDYRFFWNGRSISAVHVDAVL